MGKGDYAAAGGSLKLKGVKDSKVEKKKKKRKFEVLDADKGSTTGPTDEITSEVSDGKAKQPSPDMGQDATEDDLASVGKTEAEKRHEEMRRQRLAERLRREGVKTHKERVEELNKYLSNLSEHHDMPRIGPG